MASAARLRLMYFLYYGNVGVAQPYLAAYLRGLGFSGEQIGAVQMIPSLLAPVVAMSWATFADRHATPARGLRLATAWSALCVLALPFARTPAAVGAVLVAAALGDRAYVPLLDSVTLEHTRARPERSYASVRLFGSIGFVVLALAAGRALTLRGNRPADLLVPSLMTALVAGYALAARRLPAHAGPPRADRPGPRDMLALLRRPALPLLLGACAVHWAACAPYHLLFGVYVRDRGLPADVTGLGTAAGVAAEIGVLLLFPRLERRLSLRGLLATSFLGSAVRWALLWRAEGAAAIVLLQLLHGLTFGLFWAAAMKGMAEVVPARLRATGQALFSAVVFGAGNGLGFALSGAAYDRLGSVAPLFAGAALLELALVGVGLAAAGALAAARARGAGAGPAAP